MYDRVRVFSHVHFTILHDINFDWLASFERFYQSMTAFV